jgi:NOL1/NOP2/sun family putative RNA methylase
MDREFRPPVSGSHKAFQKYADLIPDYEAFLDSLKEEPPVSLRVNTLLIETSELIQRLRDKGIQLHPSPVGETFRLAPDVSHAGRLIEHLMGLIYTQALSSAIPPLVLDPKPGDMVIDLCAAPGSKTTQMAQQMNNLGRIIANEPYTDRHAPLQSNLRRLGVANTVVTAYDGQNFPLRWRFSKVLVDAPCSGEGHARMGPDGELWGLRPLRRDLPRVQRGLLLRAFDVLAEDGVLVYSTCTYNPMENEAVVDHLLRERSARLVPIELKIPHDPGITSWKGMSYHGELIRAWRIYPHRLTTVGFFLAQIARR